MVNATILQHPSATAKIQLVTNASATHIGAALVQKEDRNMGWSPVAFYSKTLSPTERNYSNFDHNLLALVRGVKKFRHFIEGRPFTLKSYHKPLIPSLLREKQANSPRQQHALSYLAEVTDNFVYLQGTENIMADALSCPPALPAEDPPIEVNNVNLLHSSRHMDMNKLAAAQQQDQPNLEAACRLAQQKGFSQAKSTEGIMHLVRQPEAPEITTRQMILLPEP